MTLIRRNLRMAAAAVLSCMSVLAVMSVGPAGSCGAGEAGPCEARLAQLAEPTARPTGIIGAKDHRVQVASDQYPWSAIGRINVPLGRNRIACTGTLTGPRQVVTAAHCLFNSMVNQWAKPGSVHFVLGQSGGEKFLSHSAVDSFVTSPDFKFKLEDRPRYDQIAADMIKNDWAILTLHDTLNAKPIPILPFHGVDPPALGSGAEIALAGYGIDHAYVLSVHRGCSARIDSSDSGTIVHTCDSAHGESGGPILLLRDGDASLIGIHSVSIQQFESQVGYRALAGKGAAASQFAKAAAAAAGSKEP